MGRRIREFHKQIRGVRPDGVPYHALEPEAYAWVHATLAAGIVQAHERFGLPLSASGPGAAVGRVAHARAPARDPRPRPAAHVAGVRRVLRADRRGHARAHRGRRGSARRAGPSGAPGAARAPTARCGRSPPGRSVTSSPWRPRGCCRRPCASASASPGAAAGSSSCEPSSGALRAATPVMPAYLLNTGPGYLEWRSRAARAGRRGLRAARLRPGRPARARRSRACASPPARSSPAQKEGEARRPPPVAASDYAAPYHEPARRTTPQWSTDIESEKSIPTSTLAFDDFGTRNHGAVVAALRTRCRRTTRDGDVRLGRPVRWLQRQQRFARFDRNRPANPARQVDEVRAH